MTAWDAHDMETRVRAALEAVHNNSVDGHHFGKPFVSSYQLAIELVAADPSLPDALGKDIGGLGTGSHVSIAQYIANELSKQIKAQENAHYAEGVFMSNEGVEEVAYRRPDGTLLRSSLAKTDFDMALFRLRPARVDSP